MHLMLYAFSAIASPSARAVQSWWSSQGQSNRHVGAELASLEPSWARASPRETAHTCLGVTSRRLVCRRCRHGVRRGASLPSVSRFAVGSSHRAPGSSWAGFSVSESGPGSGVGSVTSMEVLERRQARKAVARWEKGEQTVRYLISRGRLETVEVEDLAASADALIARSALRVEATAEAALQAGDVDGAYVAAYDAYRIAAESLLVRQGLRATGGDGSHMAVEDAVSAQFGTDIPAFAKPTFERLRRTRHTAQYFDPAAAPITRSDASWAIEKAQAALSGVQALLAASPPQRFG
jgi:HEPN domain